MSNRPFPWCRSALAMALHGMLLVPLLPAVANAAQAQSEARQYDLPAAPL